MSRPVFGTPPVEYDQKFLAELIKNLTLYINIQNSPHEVRGTTLNLSKLPTSSVGLRTGDVWNNAGVLTIV